ncbi:MAG: hypothetical protein KJP00_10860 [Bacteroidia bacterium]|nr:hypothetical protein [Bacteroidia bacterium]
MQNARIAKYSSLLTAMLLIFLGLSSGLGYVRLSLIIGSFLAFTIVIMVVSVRHHFKPSIYGTLAIVFIAIYAVLISSNYFIQLSAIFRDAPLLNTMDMSSPLSVFWMIEILGYFFMGMSTICLSELFKEGPFARPIRILLILNGFLGLGGVLGYWLNWGNDLMLAGLLSWNIVVPIAAFLIFLRFRK